MPLALPKDQEPGDKLFCSREKIRRNKEHLNVITLSISEKLLLADSFWQSSGISSW